MSDARCLPSSTIELDPAAVSELERSFGGQVLRPVDLGYDEQRRVWNGSVNRFPALIARCAGVADVRGAVRFARRTGLTVAVRSGGHSFPGSRSATTESSSTLAR